MWSRNSTMTNHRRPSRGSCKYGNESCRIYPRTASADTLRVPMVDGSNIIGARSSEIEEERSHEPSPGKTGYSLIEDPHLSMLADRLGMQKRISSSRESSGSGILLVIVDRKLRVAFLEQILRPSVVNVTTAMLKIKERYPEWKSMTTDNDILFSDHPVMAQKLGVTSYFCFPGHAWEKGSIENANKWIRRYIAKSSDISRYSKRFVRNLEEKMNRRIMKTLNYYRPGELLKQYRKRKQRLRAVES